jgi:4-amino-4-deoxy-L-arabinose transferase-like glycosyltransferase
MEMLARAKRFFNVQGEGMRAPWRLFWVAFAVRLLYMTLAHTYRIRPYDDHFNYAWEAGRIAKSLVTGYGYSDPFATPWMPHTGPTAWLPPLYPLLIAAVFRVFGIYSATSAWVLLAINCILSAATALAVWEIAARCFNRRVALWSGWLWALYPAAMQYAVRWVWETSLTTALFAWVLVLALRMRHIGEQQPEASRSPFSDPSSAAQPTTNNQQPTPQPATSWLLFGLLWGLIALSNSTLLLFLPVCGLWLLIGAWPDRVTHLQALRGASLATLIFIACIAPWTLRNWQAFHAFIPMRGNFGAELYMGDGPGSTGLLMTFDHPHVAPDQLKLYAALGEVRYVALRGALARNFIDAHPAHFAKIVAKRIYFFWASVPSDDPWPTETARILNFAFISLSGLFGLALALYRRTPAASLFAWAFLLLPLTYYLVTVHARFRHPLEPLMCVLGVYLFQSADRTRTWFRRTPGSELS